MKKVVPIITRGSISFGLLAVLSFATVHRVEAQSWSALSTGTNLVIKSLTLDGSGDLYAGGLFTSAGGTAASCVAQWNGASWSALGAGVDAGGKVLALAFVGSDLYMGGDFQVAGLGASTQGIAKWDGAAWSALPTGGVTSGAVEDLVVDGSGNVYAGGDFVISGIPNIAVFDGASWSALGSGVDAEVNTLLWDGSGNLYAGGAFANAGGSPASFVAKWDGAGWTALGSGVDGEVFALALDASGDLYVGGNFGMAGGNAANNVAKWNGSSWSALGSGTDSFVAALSFDADGDLIVGGGFSIAGGVGAVGIAKWSGSSWSGLTSGTDGIVEALVSDGSNNVFAGGLYSEAGGFVVNNIAKWNDGSLPVELIGFTATSDGENVRLAWQTASELQNAGFAVQSRLMRAGETETALDWRDHGFVDGIGNSSELQSYTHTVAGMAPGRYAFRLKQVDFDGTVTYSTETEVSISSSSLMALSSAFPNPFNALTQLTLSTHQAQMVVVSAYDIRGRHVATLFDGELQSDDARTVRFDAVALPAGVYFVRAAGQLGSVTTSVTLAR